MNVKQAISIDNDNELLSLAIEAYIWGFPRMLFHKYLCDFRAVDPKFNHLYIMSEMATPDQGGVNVDTLYGVAWFDLKEPIFIKVPDSDDRYYSLQFVDVYANNIDYIGRRKTGTREGTYLLTHKGWSGIVPAGVKKIEMPTRFMFCFLRTLIDNKDSDLELTNDFNRNIKTCGYSEYPSGFEQSSLMPDIEKYFPVAHSNLDQLEEAYFDHLGDALAEALPTTEVDKQQLSTFSTLGIGPGKHPTSDRPELNEIFIEAVKAGHKKIFSASSTQVRGSWAAIWEIDKRSKDPLFKATVNRFGLGSLSTEEALYLFPSVPDAENKGAASSWVSLGPNGKPLDGTNSYKLHFPADRLPEVDAFWSLTAYKEDLFLYRNTLNRYAIGDRTQNLKYNIDGSLDIYIQHDCPAGWETNWLPVPGAGFTLFFRAYQPRLCFLNGQYQLPPLELV